MSTALRYLCTCAGLLVAAGLVIGYVLRSGRSR